MTPDKVIELVERAGFILADKSPAGIAGFSHLIKLARADERERCAKACADRDMGDNNREDQEARRCEAAILALKD